MVRRTSHKRFLPQNHYRVQAVGAHKWGVYHVEGLRFVFVTKLRPDALERWADLVYEEEKNGKVRGPWSSHPQKVAGDV